MQYSEVPRQSLPRILSEMTFALGGITNQVRQRGHLHPVSLAMREVKTKMFGSYAKFSLF